MKTFEIEVTQIVRVTLDETKFTPEFMEEFNANFYYHEDLEDHAKHIAQMHARGVIELYPHSNDFIEGYGSSREMGLMAEVIDTEIYANG